MVFSFVDDALSRALIARRSSRDRVDRRLLIDHFARMDLAGPDRIDQRERTGSMAFVSLQ
jgi:hypothetical protein